MFSVMLLKAMPCVFQCGDGLNEMLEGTAKPIKPPDNQRIPLPKV